MEKWTGSKLGKDKAVYCHLCYLIYAEYIMQNARLDELQAGIKTARRNINNLRSEERRVGKVDPQKRVLCLAQVFLRFTCLLRNLYAGQKPTVRTRHGTMDWFQIEKRVHQGCILSPCLFNFYAEYIMRNGGLDEAQAEIKMAGRNVNNLRYKDDATFMAESEMELRSP